MYTSLGDPPWLTVGSPMPTPGRTTSASSVTIAPNAAGLTVLGIEPRLIAFPA
jgi:hypothetical protein